MGWAERKNQRNQDRLKYTYGEAFMLMHYRCRACGNDELLWNSRDGITPFMIDCVRCEDPSAVMDHVEWQNDVRAPEFVPQPGMRVFVNLTKERAIEGRRRYVEKYWGEDMRERWPSKEAAIEELAAHDLDSFAPTTPDVVTVSAEGWPAVERGGA